MLFSRKQRYGKGFNSDGENYDARESADQEFDQEELVQVWAGLHHSSISE